MEWVCLQECQSRGHIKRHAGWGVYLCTICAPLLCLLIRFITICRHKKHVSPQWASTAFWTETEWKARNTYSRERACKNQNDAMSHREAVRFAKEKDEMWLVKTCNNDHFHKDSHDICVFLFFGDAACRTTKALSQHVNSWREQRVIKALQYNLDRIKDPRNDLSLFVKPCVTLQPAPSLWKWQCLSHAGMQINTFDPRQSKCRILTL